jgi:hypothetical protein
VPAREHLRAHVLGDLVLRLAGFWLCWGSWPTRCTARPRPGLWTMVILSLAAIALPVGKTTRRYPPGDGAQD